MLYSEDYDVAREAGAGTQVIQTEGPGWMNRFFTDRESMDDPV
jgi:hypothetical protein